MFGQLEADVGGSLYVAGPPGTGKSLAMARLTAQLHDTTTTVVNFNCMVCPSLRSVALSHKATTHPPSPQPSPCVSRSVPAVYAANTICDLSRERSSTPVFASTLTSQSSRLGSPQSVKDPKDIYSRLLQTLMGGEKPADVAATAAARSGQHTGVPPEVAALQSLLCGVGSSKLVKQPPKAKSHVKAKSEMVVLILDEMDALITREQEV